MSAISDTALAAGGPDSLEEQIDIENHWGQGRLGVAEHVQARLPDFFFDGPSRLAAFIGMHFARSLFLLVFLTSGLSYVGCSERTNVARNKGGGDAGDGSGAKSSAGSLGVAGGDDSAEAGSNSVGGTAAGVGGTGTTVGGAGDATAGAGGAENQYPNACSTLSFAPAVSYDIEEGQINFRALAAGDLDGDDKPDLVVANTRGTASVFSNQGDGSFGEPTSIPSSGTGYGGTIDVIMFDANGDQKLDLAFVNWSFSVSVSLNQGGGTFGTPHDYMVDYTVTMGANLGSVVAGDVTGDGKPDLAVSIFELGGVGIYVNKGDGTFKDMAVYPMAVSGYGWSLALADFDEKNGLDVAVGPSGGVWLNNGDGSFAATKYKELEVGDMVAAADLNGDDLPDLVGARGFRANLQNNTFGAPGGFRSLQVQEGRIVTADMLGRGRPDVVVPGDALYPATVFPNNGDGTFAEAVPFDNPRSAGPNDAGHAVVAADFNGDDKIDLAVISNEATDGLFVVLNTCTP